MYRSKKLIFALLLGLISSQTLAMSLEGLKEQAVQKIATYSAYIPQPVKKAAALAWNNKLATAATVTIGGLAVAHATGYNPFKSVSQHVVTVQQTTIPVDSKSRYHNFHEWKAACDQSYLTGKTPLSQEAFLSELQAFVEAQNNGPLADNDN